MHFKHEQPQVLSPDTNVPNGMIQQTEEATNVLLVYRLNQRAFSISTQNQRAFSISLVLVYRLMRRDTSLIHTSEIQMSFNLSLIILELIFVNVKTLIMRSLFLEQAHGARATYMVLAGDLVPAGTKLVTPVIDLIVTTVFVGDHQVQKFSYGSKQSVFSRCCTLTPASISNAEGCLQSAKVSRAVGCIGKAILSNKRLRKN